MELSEAIRAISERQWFLIGLIGAIGAMVVTLFELQRRWSSRTENHEQRIRDLEDRAGPPRRYREAFPPKEW